MQWKDIKGYEGLYQVNLAGQIRSLPRKGTIKRMRVIKQNQSAHYAKVTLFKENSGETCLVHRLVAEAFIPNPENKPQVNHKNGNKLDNRVANLEWCTCSENNKHKFRVLGYKQPKMPTSKRIKCVETGEEYESISDASRRTGVRLSTISAASNHRKDFNGISHYVHHTAGGFHWEFI